MHRRIPILNLDPMYVATCTLRSQSVNIRWQKMIALSTVHIAMLGGLITLVVVRQLWVIIPATILGLLGVVFCDLWWGLIVRSQEWIDYYTNRLFKMEIIGRAPARVFSDTEYISGETPKQARDSLRFGDGVFTIIRVWYMVWIATFAIGFAFIVVPLLITTAL